MDKSEIITIVINETQSVVMKKLSPDQPLISTRLLDSMGVVDLTTALEVAFNIKIEARDLIPQNFETIDNIVDYISRTLHG